MNSNHSLRAAALIMSMWLASAATAQTATDVQCDGCVDAQDIAAGAVTTGKIANGAINNNKLGADSVGTAKIKDAAVTADKLGGGSVGSDALQSAAVTTDKIKNGSVGLKKVSNTVKEHVTLLEYSSTSTLAGVTGTYQELREIGTFEKLFNASTVELDWVEHGRWEDEDLDNSGFCDFQLRLDGMPMPSILSGTGSGRAILYGEGTVNNAPISLTVFYPSLATGIYTVSVWVRGPDDTCTLNFGNFARYVLVRERNEVIEMPNPMQLQQGAYGGQTHPTVVDGVPVY